MARMNESGQWIIMMGFLVSVALIFLALIINQSTLVGQTTAESVLEFPKTDIQDLRQASLEAVERANLGTLPGSETSDITKLVKNGKNAIGWYTISPWDQDCSDPKYAGTQIQQTRNVTLHYNNGVTSYDEIYGVSNVIQCP